MLRNASGWAWMAAGQLLSLIDLPTSRGQPPLPSPGLQILQSLKSVQHITELIKMIAEELISRDRILKNFRPIFMRTNLQ